MRVSGRIHGMKATIDSAGRVVIPKQIRQAAGLSAGTELDVKWTGDHIEIEAAALPVRFVREGRLLVAVPATDVGRLANEVVEATRQELFHERLP